MGIDRQPTQEELRDFVPLTKRNKRAKTAQEKFEEELGKQEQAVKKKFDKDGLQLPFASNIARFEFNDYYELEVKKNIRKNGYLLAEEIKPLKIDWTKYSDVKNFDLEDEGETLDEDLSKQNPGLHVTSKFKKYRYIGYSNTYTVMEFRADSILRAKKEQAKLTKEL